MWERSLFSGGQVVVVAIGLLTLQLKAAAAEQNTHARSSHAMVQRFHMNQRR